MHGKISPQALGHFAQYWDIGGHAGRPRDQEDFPNGLELCSASPFTLRLQCNRFQKMDAEHEEQLRQWSTQMISYFKSHGTSGHPILMQPPDAAVACRQLAIHPRMVQASLLAAALLDLGEPTGLRLFVRRYGLKVDAQSFFQEVFTPALGTMRLELGNLRAQNAWSRKVVDYGCQSRKDGCITLVWPQGNLRDIAWVNSRKNSLYSSFGKLGQGYGSLQLVGEATWL